jgi:hypothetical protein
MSAKTTTTKGEGTLLDQHTCEARSWKPANAAALQSVQLARTKKGVYD